VRYAATIRLPMKRAVSASAVGQTKIRATSSQSHRGTTRG
jgi:hypothetical protein